MIETQKAKQFKNTGYIEKNDSTTGQPSIKTYTQTKQGLTYFYAKRKLKWQCFNDAFRYIITQHFAVIFAKVGFEKNFI